MQSRLATCARYAKPATALSLKALRQVVGLASGGALQLVRIPHCHGQFSPPLQKDLAHTRIYTRVYKGCLSTSTKCAFSIQVDLRPEPLHTSRLRITNRMVSEPMITNAVANPQQIPCWPDGLTRRLASAYRGQSPRHGHHARFRQWSSGTVLSIAKNR